VTLTNASEQPFTEAAVEVGLQEDQDSVSTRRFTISVVPPGMSCSLSTAASSSRRPSFCRSGSSTTGYGHGPGRPSERWRSPHKRNVWSTASVQYMRRSSTVTLPPWDNSPTRGPHCRKGLLSRDCFVSGTASDNSYELWD
jgi:hypothetical protein